MDHYNYNDSAEYVFRDMAEDDYFSEDTHPYEGQGMTYPVRQYNQIIFSYLFRQSASLCASISLTCPIHFNFAAII